MYILSHIYLCIRHIVAFLRIITKISSSSRQEKFEELISVYGAERLLIVSNTAGARHYDDTGQAASEVERSTGVHVLNHDNKKPGCAMEIFRYFSQRPGIGVCRPNQIAIIGDRLLTDVMLANIMGSCAVWIMEGLVPPEDNSVVSLHLLDLCLIRTHEVSHFKAILRILLYCYFVFFSALLIFPNLSLPPCLSDSRSLMDGYDISVILVRPPRAEISSIFAWTRLPRS